MKKEKIHEKLDELQWAVMMDPTNEDKVRECDETEAALLAEEDYTTAADRGDLQSEFLKALDYGDMICERWRRFQVCKSGGTGNYCGLAYPSKLWFQIGRKAALNPAERLQPGNWKYKCLCMWEYLEEEASDRPGSPADEWFQDMKATYGEVANFPHIGCGAKFVPWKRGAFYGV